MESHELLELSADLASCLLSAGAEIYRVEESVQRLFAAYGAGRCQVFAIPSLLIVSLCRPGQEPLTQVRRLQEQNTDLERVRACNDLCRHLCQSTPSFAQAKEQLSLIESRPAYPGWLVFVAYGLVSFGFTLMFGGSFADAAAALLCGGAVRLTLLVLQRFGTNSFFTTILASAAAAVVACLCVRAGLGSLQDKIIIGTLMTLVPGSALTSSMRDIMAGDLIAGSTRLVTVLLSAGGIALGTGVALSAMRFLGVML